MDIVVHEIRALDHLNGIVYNSSDLASDLDLLQSHHHGPDGGLPGFSFGKQVSKLQKPSPQLFRTTFNYGNKLPELRECYSISSTNCTLGLL